jgi:hypothetical protein
MVAVSGGRLPELAAGELQHASIPKKFDRQKNLCYFSLNE